MSQPNNHDVVAASLAALDLPTDADVVAAVGAHFVRLSDVASLVMNLPIPDDVETPSIFEP